MLTRFNWIHIVLMVLTVVLTIGCYYIFRNRTRKAKTIFMGSLIAFLLISWIIVFTLDMFLKPDIRAQWLLKLPLHMCGSNVVVFPIFFLVTTLRKKKPGLITKSMYAYFFYVSSIGALLGLVMPSADVVDVVLLKDYYAINYYLRHMIMFAIPIFWVCLGFYRPRFKHAINAIVILLIFITIAHGYNLLLSYLSVKTDPPEGYVVNFFYTRNTDNNIVLDLLWRIIPFEYFYLYSGIFVLVPIFTLYYIPCIFAYKYSWNLKDKYDLYRDGSIVR